MKFNPENNMLPLKMKIHYYNYAPTGIMKIVPINSLNYLTLVDNEKTVCLSKNRSLNPDISNLQDAAPRFPAPSLAEIIHNTQSGIYGSAEVNSNQIW
jgi:hypothetical protein